jgi:hypothetical protein
MMRFIAAIRNRNIVETAVRTVAPISFQGANHESKCEGNALLVAAIANTARNTMRE